MNLKLIQLKMNETIQELLCNTSTDPGWSELYGAAACLFVLKELNLKIENEKDVITELSGNNIHNHNFMRENE